MINIIGAVFICRDASLCGSLYRDLFCASALFMQTVILGSALVGIRGNDPMQKLDQAIQLLPLISF